MRLRTNGKYSRVQKCCECGLKGKPLMIIGNEPDDWVWPDCYDCGDTICPDCACQDRDPEGGDILRCCLCYQGKIILERI